MHPSALEYLHQVHFVTESKIYVWLKFSQRIYIFIQIFITSFQGCDDALEFDLDNTDQEIPADIIMGDQGRQISICLLYFLQKKKSTIFLGQMLDTELDLNLAQQMDDEVDIVMNADLDEQND